MDIPIYRQILWIFSIIILACAHDLYICSWPTNEVAQLQCDYVNCPYISINQVTVSRLVGHISDCSILNANVSTRVPIKSCTYRVMENSENRDLLMQVKANCSRKEVCEVHTRKDWLFESVGSCGHEVNDVFAIRNWVHIDYSCVGDIPGLTCVPRATTTVATTQAPLPSTEPTTTPGRRATRPPKPGKADKSNTSQIVTLIIPILGTLLFLTFILIIATVLYRHRVCRKRSWQQTVEDRLQTRAEQKTKQMAQVKVDSLHQYKIDSSKLKDLEKRLNGEHPKTNNDYFHDLAFTNLAKSAEDLRDGPVKTRGPGKKGRRSSLEQQTHSAMLPAEMYFSDSSVSTTTTEDCDFDSSGRRKRRRTPFPPLPKPEIRHSEVYFTETETESEAPNRRKDVIPKVDPPPKVHRDRKHDRTRGHKSNSATDLSNRTSLDLALTKLAAKKLTAHEQRARLANKKPAARPRSHKPSSSSVVYGNATNTYPVNFIDQNPQLKRCSTLPPDNMYRNVL